MATKTRATYTYIRNSFERDEFMKCKHNPIYFFNKYVRIPHPMKGDVPFKMYPFQIALVLVYLKHRYNICLKPRQMGISTLVAAYALWLALFHSHKYILIVSIKQATARALLRRVKFMYIRLPDFLKVEVLNGTATTVGSADEIRWANGSEIKVTGSTDNAGRSDALSCLIIDEAAFQQHADTTWGAAQPTLSTGGQAIILSTAFGVGNFFHNTYISAMQNLNGFFPVRLRWQDHPDRGQQWYEETARSLGAKRLAQEIDCNFLQSGFNVFDMAKIRAVEDRITEFPAIEKRLNDTVHIFKRPVPGDTYYIGGDVASGRARDYSSLSIFDMQGTEYACFKGKMTIRDYAYLLGDIGYEYNQAWLAPEVNAIGEGVVATLQENSYPNIWHSVSKVLKMEQFEADQNMIPGWLTTGKSRHEIITGMDADLTDESIELNNPFFVQEANTFIYNSRNKPIALGKDQGGGGIKSSNMYEEDGAVVYTDDSIIGACIGNEIRKIGQKHRGPLPFMSMN